MRKSLLIIILILFSLYSFSQAYVPFPEDSARWCLKSGGGDDPYEAPIIDSWNGFYYELKGDTLINGKVYHNLDYVKTWYYKAIDGIINSYNNDDVLIGQAGGIREDSQRVYFYKYDNTVFDLLGDNFPDTTDILLYDFSVQENDTIHYPELPGSWAFDAIVLNIDTVILIDGVPRKRFELSGNWGILHITEGIGENITGLFGPYIYNFESFIYLDCYWEKNNYLMGNDSCDYYELFNPVINLISDHSFSIYPNPFETSFLIKAMANDLPAIVSIYNIYGNLIYQTQSINKELKIDLDDSAAGIYLLTLENDQKLMHAQYIVKL
jgi:hypothetical protein